MRIYCSVAWERTKQLQTYYSSIMDLIEIEIMLKIFEQCITIFHLTGKQKMLVRKKQKKKKEKKIRKK